MVIVVNLKLIDCVLATQRVGEVLGMKRQVVLRGHRVSHVVHLWTSRILHALLFVLCSCSGVVRAMFLSEDWQQ